MLIHNWCGGEIWADREVVGSELKTLGYRCLGCEATNVPVEALVAPENFYKLKRLVEEHRAKYPASKLKLDIRAVVEMATLHGDDVLDELLMGYASEVRFEEAIARGVPLEEAFRLSGGRS